MTAAERRRVPRLVALPDRRSLAYEEHGDPAGTAVLYFAGGGDSRISCHPDDSIAERLGVRLVAVDRPGVGLSDPLPRRTLAGWADDVAVLGDALGIDRFAVLGWSAGGPHALACAWALPDRVSRAVVAAGMPERPLEHMRPRRLRATLRLARLSPRLVTRALARWGTQPPPPTCDPACDAAYASGRREAFRQGSAALAEELQLLMRGWGFPVEEIRVPVALVYGELDRVCPPSIGRELERRIPGATLRVVADRHQLLFSRWEELLALAAAPAAPRAEP